MINWKKVAYNDELAEFERTARAFTTADNDIKTNVATLKLKYKTAKLKTLSLSDWKRLRNTDSYMTETIESAQKSIKRNGEPRNLISIINEFITGSVRAPIALQLSDKSLYLVAGNTRLMVARFLDIKPRIVVVETDW